MSCSPTSPESLEGLRDLLRSAAQRGDECFALLLAGVDLCVRVGREMEMLEAMRQHAHDMRDAVEGTPTADELRRLYESD